MQHRIRYRLTVLPDRPGAKIGSRVRCWLPFPQLYRQQRDLKLLRTKPVQHILSPSFDERSGSGGAWQRTVYLEQRIENISQPVVFEEEFTYVSSAYYPVLDDTLARPLPIPFDDGCLNERLPHIVFTPEVRRIVKAVLKDETNPLKQARKLFHFVAEQIQYCAEEEYSIIPSLSTRAIQMRRGDCGVRSMLFITLCRAAGIPARWQSGWYTRPDAWDMHDWAEFYVEPWGWLPADVSFGLRDSKDSELRMFYFGHLDAYRMIVNLDYGMELTPSKVSLRSEPADFQRGEVEMDGRNLYFDEWDYDFDCTVESLNP
jgi:transglutaminase-like putative cysteine protease